MKVENVIKLIRNIEKNLQNYEFFEADYVVNSVPL